MGGSRNYYQVSAHFACGEPEQQEHGVLGAFVRLRVSSVSVTSVKYEKPEMDSQGILCWVL